MMYKAYLFKNKDPVIDELRTVIEDSYGEKLNGHQLRDIENSGGPSEAAMRGWFYGKTKRPNNCTIEAAGRSLGYLRKWVKK